MSSAISSTILQMRNLRAEEYLSNYSGLAIPNISDDALVKVREVLREGMMYGINPDKVALELVGRVDPTTNQRIGGILGLPEKEIAAVAEAKKYLENLDEAYLSLELRDKRFDKGFKKALSLKAHLPPDKIEKIISIYENRVLLDYGQGIARTAMIRSLNHAEFKAALVVIEEGNITYEAIRKYWDDCGDNKVRPTHAAMGIKYNKDNAIAIDEPFISPSGAQFLYPSDTSLGAPFEEVERCRCGLGITINFRLMDED